MSAYYCIEWQHRVTPTCGILRYLESEDPDSIKHIWKELKSRDGFKVRDIHVSANGKEFDPRRPWPLVLISYPAQPGDKKADKPSRRDILLRAAYDLLEKADRSPFVQNAMEITVDYDEAECDGSCLRDDIAIELGIERPGL